MPNIVKGYKKLTLTKALHKVQPLLVLLSIGFFFFVVPSEGISQLQEQSITFENVTKTYGDPPFILTATSNSTGAKAYSILNDGGTGTVIIGTNTDSVILGQSGTVMIRVIVDSSGIYRKDTADMTLLINKALLTVTAHDTVRIYGDPNPIFRVSYKGFKNTDNTDSLTSVPQAMTTATVLSNVGDSIIRVSGGSDDNYDFDYINGTLTISQAVLTTTAADTMRLYGDSNPAFRVIYTGFKNDDDTLDLTTVPHAMSSATILSDVGDSIITVGGGSDDNYSFSYVPGTLSIKKAPLTARADDKLRIVGEPNPPFTISYSGFKNGQDESVLDIKPSAMTIADKKSNPGKYPIVPKDGLDNNYYFIYQEGVLTIIDEPIIALPGDASYSTEVAPQGGYRYQRMYYLIIPEEMSKSALEVDSMINSIGFVIAAAQDTSTKGLLKVYLQNTVDTASRLDTTWATRTVGPSGQYELSDLVMGSYEWGVQAQCDDDVSDFTVISGFTTGDTTRCNAPGNVVADQITDTSAILRWNATYSAGFSDFTIRFSKSGSGAADSIILITDRTVTSLLISGLSPNSFYQWSIQTDCTDKESTTSFGFFSTLSQSNCSSPTGLRLGAITDSSAVVRWDTTFIVANYYTVQYRRGGSFNWVGLTAFRDSFIIDDLAHGTLYQWRLRTECAEGQGTYIYGPSFTTAGDPICYPPENIRSSAINETNVLLSWDTIPGVAAYTLRYRLKNSVIWDNIVDSMTLVHSDSIAIPDTIGKFRIPFQGTGIDTVHYKGGGLYVALEYANGAGGLSSFNKAIATLANNDILDTNGQDSITFVLSLVTSYDENATGHDSLLLATEYRPETWLGTPGLQDSVEVAAVYALGEYALSYTDTARISALVINHGDVSKEFLVNLTIKDQASGEERYSLDTMVTIGGDTSALIHFNQWVPDRIERDSIIVSVAASGAEKVLNNNRMYYMQNVNKSAVAYDDGSDAVTHAGFGTGSGLILCRYRMDGCGSVNAASIYLDFSTRGKELYAVIMDDSGTLIDSSELFTPDSTEVNLYHSFYFPETPFFTDREYYVGLAQKAGGDPDLYPVGVQWEGVYIRDSAYYRADINGTGLKNHPYPGRLMIKAEIVPGYPLVSIYGNETLCAGTVDTLRAGTKISRYAISVIDVSSEFGKNDYGSIRTLGPPDVYPEYGNGVNQWIPSTADGQREYIVLGFPNPAPINFIDIYEIINPGSIDTVYVKNSVTGAFIPVYSGKAEAGSAQEATIKHISFDTTNFPVSEIRIAMATDSIPGFQSIDAVAIGLESDTSSFVSYLWSNGKTTPFISVDTAGKYSVIVTDINGCTSTDSIVIVTPLQSRPELSIANSMRKDTTFCIGASIVLKSDRTGDNMWNIDIVADSIVADTSGIFFLDYDDGAGCGFLRSDTILIMLDTLPVPVISGTLGFCPGGSTILEAPGGYVSYMWSVDSTDQTISVNSVRSFSVRVTDDKSCSGTSDEVSTVNTNPIMPVIDGILSICPKDSSLLDVGKYVTYAWSTGDTTQTIFVRPEQSVSVTVRDSLGCIGEAEINTVNAPPLSPVISGDLSFCPGDSTLLDVGHYASYSWSTGDTTQTIFVKAQQTYSVFVEDSLGCSGIADTATIVFTAPEANIQGDVSFCPGDSTLLDAGDFTSYLWHTGETTRSIYMSTARIVKLMVTDSNGCTDRDDVTTSFYGIPTPKIDGRNAFCPGDSTLLEAELGFTAYAWSTGASSVEINVNSIGTYMVTVTNDNGCKGVDSISVSEYEAPVPFISGALGFCGGSIVQLNAEGPYVSYDWNTGETSQGVIIDSAGGYSVTVEDIRGCKGSASVQVSETSSVPQMPGPITATSVISGDSVLLQFSIDPVANTSFYEWTIPEGMTIIGDQDLSTIVISIDTIVSGEVIVYAINGCGSSPSIDPRILEFQAPLFGDCNQSDYVNNGDPLTTGIYLGRTISSSGRVPDRANVLFRPTEEVNLNIGFCVNLGALFEVAITNCDK